VLKGGRGTSYRFDEIYNRNISSQDLSSGGRPGGRTGE